LMPDDIAAFERAWKYFLLVEDHHF
jgi:hypothetical protein